MTEAATGLFLSTVDKVPDDGFTAEVLPGWTRAHVVAHVAANADALRRLIAWARTGVPTPMYASAGDRAREIELGAARPPAELRAQVRATATAFAEDVASLPGDRWRAEVVTAQGRTVPASEILWLRTREVAVHAVDLDAGTDFADLPDGVCEALVADVARWRDKKANGPALTLTCAGQTWHVTGHGDPLSVTMSAPELAAWLTGRRRFPALPALPPWL
ncbi:maleylpyruvate isomerase family mycothiol-dependent enzyme [Kibdelosporangium persicum]|uniref:Mycothiol-dependent maleylpyruvate isomerase n=1 Tax=Kibdelosporangium persicum TaxID=2698649 RepID=A0ABX2FAM0_9PSEU|nr:maleylpyruvate isomerase family mycothiol-dependent enzyme [Kibdelosporangium persicum]NRN67937.1 Mycothiol-dependent maleylpyruvate isomerase [Kibdelosporangium persicum]